MTIVRVTPLALDRAIGTARLGGQVVEVFPNHEFVRSFNAMLQRQGGATTDLIAETVAAASAAQQAASSAAVAAIAAYDAGAPTSVALNPANPIATTIVSSLQATVAVAAHTRTPAGGSPISLNAGAVAGSISRGVGYAIYYVDPTDAGGAVTYLATQDSAVSGDYAGGARIVGYVSAPEQTSVPGHGAQPN